jgi:hypothetical protein
MQIKRISSGLLIAAALFCAAPAVFADEVKLACPGEEAISISRSNKNTKGSDQVSPPAADRPIRPDRPDPSGRLIIIGFVGGHIRADNLVHKEVQLAGNLRQRYPGRVKSAVFANHDGDAALGAVLQFLDENSSGCLSSHEKQDARIVIYGHSWGASETVTLARRLNKLNIPVLLTVQVDSVRKTGENDAAIPPNVHEAVNFYQSEGMLHGRSEIDAMDPSRTTILGNFASTYRHKRVSCDGYPWYARTFMRPHIEIENDPMVWGRIQDLIATKIDN